MKGGKSFSLLLDPVRNWRVKDFGGITFRRTAKQVRNEGSLWDESMKLYPHLKAIPIESRLEWRFPSGASLSYDHLEYEKDVLNHQGAQYAWIGFDELTHFTRHQFFYMLSRLRSTCGVKPRIRATTNPDPDSWVRDFISWWIGEDGFPIPERSGVLRWFIRRNDEMIWAGTKEEIFSQFGNGEDVRPLSVTFIPAKLADNKILMDKNPEYLSNLMGLDRVTRAQLLDGNWNIRASAGLMFKREWFEVVDAIPAGYTDAVRFWDRAATKPSEKNKNPDWTRGGLMLRYPSGMYLFADLKSLQDTPGQVEKLIKNTATQDGLRTRILCQRDPGSAGVAEAEQFTKMLAGFDVGTESFSSDKVTRAKAVSAQSEAGNVKVLRAQWNTAFFEELEAFPEGAHDDIVDVLSGAFNELSQKSAGSFAKFGKGSGGTPSSGYGRTDTTPTW